MKVSETTVKWVVWVVLTILASVWLGYSMISDTADKTIFMPGALSPGHHQLAEACDACHVDAFGGGEVLQQSCVDCHGEESRMDWEALGYYGDPIRWGGRGQVIGLNESQ